MKVLLIGGSGLIGYYLVPQLLREGHDVTVISRGNRPLNASNITHIRGDRRTLFTSHGIQGDFDVVIDNAAYAPSDCQNLMESMTGRIDHYIVTSTAFVYPNPETHPSDRVRLLLESDAVLDVDFDMHHPQNTHEQYVDDKRRVEFWLRHNTRRFDVKTTVLRPYFQIVGPNTNDGRFAWFWLRVNDGGNIWIPNEVRLREGRCQLAFSGDVAKVILGALRHPPEQYAVYNVAQPDLWTHEEYIRMMANVAGTTSRIHYAPRQVLDERVGGTYRIPLPYCTPVDVSKAQSELGVSFTPMKTWIQETGQWMTEFYRHSIPSWYESRSLELS